jgi:hypothetical protein
VEAREEKQPRGAPARNRLRVICPSRAAMLIYHVGATAGSGAFWYWTKFAHSMKWAGLRRRQAVDFRLGYL